VDESEPTTQTPVCYRHPNRQALLRCSRCERPICADDMIEAPVGYQCPECASGGTRVRHLTELMPDFTVTKGLVATIAVLYLVSRTGDFTLQFGLVPRCVGGGPVAPACTGDLEVWRLVTSGFLHANLMHIAFNGILLWRLGQMLEPVLGHARFGALYAAGLAGGSLGVVALAWLTARTALPDIPVLGYVFATAPNGVTIGASGAVFGLMGAAMAGLRARGVDPWRTDIGSLVLLNLVLTFLIGFISVGGHLGGLIAGLVAGKLLFVDRDKAGRATVVSALAAIGMLVLAVALARATVG